MNLRQMAKVTEFIQEISSANIAFFCYDLFKFHQIDNTMWIMRIVLAHRMLPASMLEMSTARET